MKKRNSCEEPCSYLVCSLMKVQTVLCWLYQCTVQVEEPFNQGLDGYYMASPSEEWKFNSVLSQSYILTT